MTFTVMRELMVMVTLSYWMGSLSSAFVLLPYGRHCTFHSMRHPYHYCPTLPVLKSSEDDKNADDGNGDTEEGDDWILDDEELEILFEDENGEEEDDEEDGDGDLSISDVPRILDNMELAWRHAGKPLLRIGAKGATVTHGNSLRELLEAHTAVKVKINTRDYESLEDGFEVLKMLAEDSGAPPGLELLQARKGDSTIMCGLPGTMEKILNGEFPPPDANGADP